MMKKHYVIDSILDEYYRLKSKEVTTHTQRTLEKVPDGLSFFKNDVGYITEKEIKEVIQNFNSALQPQAFPPMVVNGEVWETGTYRQGVTLILHPNTGYKITDIQGTGINDQDGTWTVLDNQDGTWTISGEALEVNVITEKIN